MAPPPYKKALKPNLDDISDGYYYELIEHQINLASQTKYYKDIKVLFDQSGIENLGQVQVTFDPHFQKLQLHELKIIRNGKDINLFVKKYNKSKPIIIKPYDEADYDQIGGWMIVLLIVLFINILTLSGIFFFQQSFFNLNTWQAVDQVAGISSFSYKILLLVEMIGNVLILAGLIYSVILLIKKRDIFAQTFFIVALFMAIFCTMDGIAYYFIFNGYLDKTEDLFTTYKDHIRAILFFCIWGTYAYNSERVKGTCLRTYDDENPMQRAITPHPFDQDFLKPYPIQEQNKETASREYKTQKNEVDQEQPDDNQVRN